MCLKKNTEGTKYSVWVFSWRITKYTCVIKVKLAFLSVFVKFTAAQLSVGPSGTERPFFLAKNLFDVSAAKCQGFGGSLWIRLRDFLKWLLNAPENVLGTCTFCNRCLYFCRSLRWSFILKGCSFWWGVTVECSVHGWVLGFPSPFQEPSYCFTWSEAVETMELKLCSQLCSLFMLYRRRNYFPSPLVLLSWVCKMGWCHLWILQPSWTFV